MTSATYYHYQCPGAGCAMRESVVSDVRTESEHPRAPIPCPICGAAMDFRGSSFADADGCLVRCKDCDGARLCEEHLRRRDGAELAALVGEATDGDLAFAMRLSARFFRYNKDWPPPVFVSGVLEGLAAARSGKDADQGCPKEEAK